MGAGGARDGRTGVSPPARRRGRKALAQPQTDFV
jgi:hypothetical protein